MKLVIVTDKLHLNQYQRGVVVDMAAPQQPNQSDNSMAILWGTAAVFVAIGIIWYVFKDYIALYYLHLKLYEVEFLSLFDEQYFSPLRSTISTTLATNYASIPFNNLLQLGTEVGHIIRYPIVILLVACGLLLYFGNAAHVYKRTYNMNDLAKLEKNNWPQINPVIGLNLLKMDIDTGPWAMAMTPMQFAKRNKLIEEVRPERREGMSRREWDKIDIVLKRGDTNKLFAMQLGPVWQGIDKLPRHTRALFAAFACRVNADSKSAAKLLAQLAATATSKLDTSGVNELLKKHANSKEVKQIIASHAYVYTVMASMLQGAREDGVQASADFLWLKPLDRKLWYTLNMVGRQTPFVEVAGIFAHWIAEKEASGKLLVPVVEEATKALEIALKEVIYRPEVTA